MRSFPEGMRFQSVSINSAASIQTLYGRRDDRVEKKAGRTSGASTFQHIGHDLFVKLFSLCELDICGAIRVESNAHLFLPVTDTPESPDRNDPYIA